MLFLCVAGHGVTSLFGTVIPIEVGVPVLLPVSEVAWQLVENVNLLKIVRGSDFNAMISVMAWRAMWSIQSDSLATDDSVPFVRFGPVTYVAPWGGAAVAYAAGGSPLLDVVTDFVLAYFDFTKFHEGGISGPVATPNLVDATPGPSQAHVRVLMTDTISSALVAPTLSCVDLSVISSMPASAGRPAAPLLIFGFQCSDSSQARRSCG